MASIYKITKKDRQFIEEFRRVPVGHHSPGLQRILNVFRGEALEGKYVLVCTKPHREWTLAQLKGQKGQPLQVLPNMRYRQPIDAEWDVFRLRWRKYTGEKLIDGAPVKNPRAGAVTLRLPKITAYADRLYARPGDTIKFMVSCDRVGSYQSDIVRLINADDCPLGPGFKEHLVRSPVSRRRKGRKQHISAGSHGLVPNSPSLENLESFSVQALVWPTTPDRGRQGILSKSSHQQGGFALIIDEKGAIALRLVDGRGRHDLISTGTPMGARRWYFVGATYDCITRRVCVFQEPVKRVPGIEDRASLARRAKVAGTIGNTAPVVIAALAESSRMGGQAPVSCHYNGKIENPRIANRPLTYFERVQFQNAISPALRDSVVAAWDFSKSISSEQLVDVSDNHNHGETVNLPARGVTGARWTGEATDWKALPEHWSAIHFHDDDLYDAGWDVNFQFTVPRRMRSGIYAARLRSGKDEEYVPFFVSPAPGKEAKIALLLPTATYMAYANEHMGVDGDVCELQGGHLVVLQPHHLFLNEHREYGNSLYDEHPDGSGVFYSSRLRPILNMRPKTQEIFGFGASTPWGLCADSHIAGWLEARGYRYDVITDEELHERGVNLLEKYRVVITGTHPEYYSTAMLDAIQAYTDRGGRLMYLGGNGFYWRIAFHPSKPGVIEVRRNEVGMRAWASQPGEYYHSFNGEYGGLWRNLGRSPQSVVGVGVSVEGFDLCSYYRRKPDSFNAKVSFIFKGIGKDELIGNFGLTGGGAAGLETDRISRILGSPPNIFLLASSENHTDTCLLVPEETIDALQYRGGHEHPWVRADMVFFETPNGGAVFSTGSIAWATSLCHTRYNNNVSRITKNVLDRFVKPSPF